MRIRARTESVYEVEHGPEDAVQALWRLQNDARYGRQAPTEEGLLCPNGHSGPWRWVEAIEVWREVVVVEGSRLQVNAHWATGEGYHDGIPGSGYLECRAHSDGGYCAEPIQVPSGFEFELV